MKVAKPLISLAVVYLLLGPILFLLERNQLGMEALKQLLPITLLGAFFFAFSFFELAFGDRLRRTQNKTMTVDGRWSTIGTANIDRLSMRGNYEVCLPIR